MALSAVGIYGVSAYLAAERRKEMGIRMALGADFANIATLMLRGSLAATAIGLAAGGVAAMALARLLEAQLVGVQPYDPPTLATAALILLAAAVLATAQPAFSVALTDPAATLRRD